jgi:hypothetical protein
MKYLIITAGTLVVIFTAAQAYVVNDLAKTEQQAYEVIWKNDIIEARYYPKAVMATVTGSSSDYKSSSNQHFRVLAGYIFGGNEKSQSIPMTSPVHMTFDEKGSEMSFVMPSNMALDGLPKPNDRGIKFSESEEKYVVAIRFGGWSNDEKIKQNSDLLIKALETMGIEPQSAPWYMGYNPPFQLVNRRNEVAVVVSAIDLELIKML